MNKFRPFPDAKVSESTWKVLYIIGGVAALTAVLVFRRNLAVELMTFNGFGLFSMPDAWPINAVDWFTLFQDDRFVGLVLFNLIDLVNYALVGLIFLALYGALRKTHKRAMVIATSFTFAGVAIFFASNQAFSMLSFSNRYAEATTDAQRAEFLDAGEALLAVDNPGAVYQGTGYYLGLLLVILAGLIISIVMLRSNVFSKATAYTGIAANVLILCFFISLAFMPEIIWLFPTLSAPFRMIWYILIAFRLFRLGRETQGSDNMQQDTST
jgi:hypothetical protein